MNSVHQFIVKDLRGKEISLSQYKGKVLLIVNTASRCGYTPQLKGLEELYKKYKDKGFVVLGFPSNDFGRQEPLEGEKIKEFCEVNYGVSFPVFEKIHVKGSKAHPLYKFLSQKKQFGLMSSEPKWNFHKFLVDKEGKVVDFFFTITKPDSPKITRKIEKLLQQPTPLK